MTIHLTTEQSRILFHLLHRILFSGDERGLRSGERTVLSELLKSLTEKGVA